MGVRPVVAVAFALALALGASAPAVQAVPRHRLRTIATAYCQKGLTKNGHPVRRGVIAADPAVLPLGTIVRVEVPVTTRASGIYTVDDTGGAVKGHRIDIYMPSCARARRFGRRVSIVEVLTRAEASRVSATD